MEKISLAYLSCRNKSTAIGVCHIALLAKALRNTICASNAIEDFCSFPCTTYNEVLTNEHKLHIHLPDELIVLLQTSSYGSPYGVLHQIIIAMIYTKTCFTCFDMMLFYSCINGHKQIGSDFIILSLICNHQNANTIQKC
jgi:hypothetical protein